MKYFFGADLGATKTHALIADENGNALGFGEGGPANHESVGYDGMYESMRGTLEQALKSSGVEKADIAGAGFGVAGYDWTSEYELTAKTIERLGLNAPYKFVNDTVPGLLAGSGEGWGVVVVSGTGSNCRGWDREHKHEGRVTGHGVMMGEGAGGSELMHRCMQLVGYAWSKRGPMTRLVDLIIEHTGAKDLDNLIHGYTTGVYQVSADAAPLVFRAAEEGDAVANDLIRWAGRELGELANAVIRQLEIKRLAFDVVLTGSMFNGGSILIEPMRETIHTLAPNARLIKLDVPPVMGAILLGMEAIGSKISPSIRKNLKATLANTQQLKAKQL